MTKEKKNMLLWALANGHPCNTSCDYSVSIVRCWYGDQVDYDVNVFPAGGRPWFIDMAIEHLLAISVAMHFHFSIHCVQGVPVAQFR